MYFAISLLSSHGRGRSPSLAHTWIPFTKGCFVPSSIEIGTVVLEKKIKMWKVYGQTPLYDVLPFVINIEHVCIGFTFNLLILILKMYVGVKYYKLWKFENQSCNQILESFGICKYSNVFHTTFNYIQFIVTVKRFMAMILVNLHVN